MELSPSLISLTVSVDVKHYVLLLLVYKARGRVVFESKGNALQGCADQTVN